MRYAVAVVATQQILFDGLIAPSQFAAAFSLLQRPVIIHSTRHDIHCGIAQSSRAHLFSYSGAYPGKSVGKVSILSHCPGYLRSRYYQLFLYFFSRLCCVSFCDSFRCFSISGLGRLCSRMHSIRSYLIFSCLYFAHRSSRSFVKFGHINHYSCFRLTRRNCCGIICGVIFTPFLSEKIHFHIP